MIKFENIEFLNKIFNKVDKLNRENNFYVNVKRKIVFTK